MDALSYYNALVIPSDNRSPYFTSLTTSQNTSEPYHGVVPAEPYRCGKIPHPEILMDYINFTLGEKAWSFRVSPVQTQLLPLIDTTSQIVPTGS